MNMEHSNTASEHQPDDREIVREAVERLGLPYARIPAIMDRLTALYRAGLSDSGDGRVHSHFEDESELSQFAHNMADRLEASGESDEELDRWKTMEDILFLQDIGKAGPADYSSGAVEQSNPPAVLYAVEDVRDRVNVSVGRVVQDNLELTGRAARDFERNILGYLKFAEERYIELMGDNSGVNGERAAILRNAPDDALWSSFTTGALTDLSDEQVERIASSARMRFFWDAHSVHSEAVLSENRDQCVEALKESQACSKEEAEETFQHIRRGVGSHHRVEGISVIQDDELVGDRASIRSACIDKMHAFLKRSGKTADMSVDESWEAACNDTRARVDSSLDGDKSGQLRQSYMREIDYLQYHSYIGRMLVEQVNSNSSHVA